MATFVRTRSGDGQFVLAKVVASCRVGEHVLLIHECIMGRGGFTATYAPVGLCIGSYPTIQDVLGAIDLKIRSVTTGIMSSIEYMLQQHQPLLSSEYGIEIEEGWQDRERERFKTGEYLPVPQVLDLEYPKEHFLHLSVDKAETDFVAYTPNDEYGKRDRQVRIKFGKYLRKTFEHLSDADVKQAVSELRGKLALANAPIELRFATDRETINKIFETAMCACDSSAISCMHGKFDNWKIRPYHVYADSPDVAVAYASKADEILARSVVSTKDKRWVCLYSTEHDGCAVLEALLEEAGYREGALYGNRLTVLDTPDVMLPYIDHGGCLVKHVHAKDGKEYWRVVKEDGDYEASNTDGTADCVKPRCRSCNNFEDECECIYCDCCEERYYDGCGRCDMCPRCGLCHTHGNCECDRCSNCNELTDECECEKEDEDENAGVEITVVARDVDVSAASPF